MQQPPLDPDIADEAPVASVLTGYDEQHLVTYLHLLDAEEDGADWKEVAWIVLHRDSARLGNPLGPGVVDDRARVPTSAPGAAHRTESKPRLTVPPQPAPPSSGAGCVSP